MSIDKKSITERIDQDNNLRITTERVEENKASGDAVVPGPGAPHNAVSGPNGNEARDQHVRTTLDE